MTRRDTGTALRPSRRAVLLAGALGLAPLRRGLAQQAEGAVTVNGRRLHHVALGAGRPVVFVHGGLGFDHQYFRPFVDKLAASARVVLYDQLGHGRSERPPDFRELTLDRLADDVDGLMTALGHQRYVLVGHSYGGFVALTAALKRPERLSGLVLLCTAADLRSGMRNPLGGTEEQQRALREGLFGGPARNGTDAALRANWVTAVPLYYFNATVSPALVTDVDARTIYSAAAFRRGGEIISRDAGSPVYYDLVPRLHELRMPTLVGYGSGDIWRFGDDERIAKNIQGSRLRYFEKSGHWPFQEEPDAFLTEMNGFLRSLGT